jgi:hypothetical protein
MINLLLHKKRWLLIISISVLLVFLSYKFFTDWRHTIPSNSEVMISLQRTECFGTCPIYKITIYGNGLVVYEGRAYVGTRGIRKSFIGTDKVIQLATELENAGYFSLDDSYNEPNDLPSAVIYAKINNKEKSIVHNHELSSNSPEILYSIEKAIDEAANSLQWVQACYFWHPNFCNYNLVFWIIATMPLVIALSIAWSFIKKHRVIVGIILGAAAVSMIWTFVVLVINNSDQFGLWSTTVFYSILGFIELVAVISIGLFLAKRYKRNIIQKGTG